MRLKVGMLKLTLSGLREKVVKLSSSELELKYILDKIRLETKI